MAKRLNNAGITVEDAIAFANWVVDDDARRAAGFEQMKRDMDTVAQIGAKHIAAPPMGATDNANLDLHKAAERYRARYWSLGEKTGVHPLLELWGHSKCLNRLADVAFVAIESARPDASMLLDIYHLHKGGTDYASLRQINGANLHLIHMNDFPATPDRAHITDANRVYPGDIMSPFKQILHRLARQRLPWISFLELFNRDYWKENPEKVAKTGIEKDACDVVKREPRLTRGIEQIR